MPADPPTRPPIHHPLPDALPLTRAVPRLYGRIIRQGCGGKFAVVWAEALPLGPGRSGVEIVDEVTHRVEGDSFPEEYLEALGDGVHRSWTLGDGPRPAYSARIRVTDARWHPVDSNPISFRAVGEYLAAEITACLGEGRAPRPLMLPGTRPPLPWERELLHPEHGGAP
ncbi:hypothetical protein [Nocardiopsis valliformis]|uniref:hypothetical protein n=1 Tax=Nocardiopsis valliformis TaxID=239974 RepID=UPI000A028851|nr:hypothetical protein [Nocardiopsis valliformis]